MPAKNVIKTYVPDSYYHVYNRGVSKQTIFHDEQDYEVFLGLLKRYLSPVPTLRANRTPYPSYAGEVRLLSYCLMPNHFHLQLYQISEEGMQLLLKSVSVAYSMYFNKRYKRIGAVFQQRYRAVLIENDGQLVHISRYIHMNPTHYNSWEWSSLPYYLNKRHADWVQPYISEDIVDYGLFLKEYESRRNELEKLKHELAG